MTTVDADELTPRDRLMRNLAHDWRSHAEKRHPLLRPEFSMFHAVCESLLERDERITALEARIAQLEKTT